MEKKEEFNIERIFDQLDRLINNESNKYIYYDYKPHLHRYLELKNTYQATKAWREDRTDIY